ncbi:hypothetical protein F511_27403 [Dorcoceras hygrometricum]|uniref:Uncharacterized protein n=1 Tax=Dorcoceras hygrometricum TaxID=472368 RepID=A0A2Z7C6W3_9LAMI|nr:hypothetical protein F511_27403 [Dorcoceras hygrometricum]
MGRQSPGNRTWSIIPSIYPQHSYYSLGNSQECIQRSNYPSFPNATNMVLAFNAFLETLSNPKKLGWPHHS